MGTTIISGFTSNNYGRKITIIVTYTIGSISVFLLGFPVNYWLTLTTIAMTGCLFPFANYCSLWLNEIGDDSFRNTANGWI